MHEMSLVEGVLQLIEDAARKDGFTKVTAVWLEIGQLSSVEPEAMAFCFDAVMRGTVAEGARLEIISVPGQAWCNACNMTVDVPDALGTCPQCGGVDLKVTGGNRMRVKELEVQ
jgi:hydrogenase nickel incorporation protein HypA/HybF